MRFLSKVKINKEIVAVIISALSALASWRSSLSSAHSAEVSAESLGLQTSTILTAACEASVKGSPDYILFLASKNDSDNRLFSTHEIQSAIPSNHEYRPCVIANSGQYPLLNVHLLFDAAFERSDKSGNGIGPVLERHRIDAMFQVIEPKQSILLWVTNNDPQKTAAFVIEPMVTLLAPSYTTTTTYHLPGIDNTTPSAALRPARFTQLRK
jgi:hypothetical protein